MSATLQTHEGDLKVRRESAAAKYSLRCWVRRVWRSAHLTDISVVFGWTTAANILLFLFLALVARSLAPSQYGLFAALMGIVVLFGFGLLAVQTATATAVSGLSREAAARMARRGTPRLLLGTGCLFLVLCLLSPVAARFLHTGGVVAPIAAAAFIAVLVPWTALLGVFQGTSRFGALGGLTFLQALTRLLAAAALAFVTDVSAVFVIAAASVLPVMAIGVALMGPTADRVSVAYVVERPPRRAASLRTFPLALLTAFAVGFPTVGDVILVRHVYSPRDAGLFAGAALVARVVLFLPLAVNAVLYPRYLALPDTAQKVRIQRYGLLVTAAMGGLAVVVFSVFSDLSLRLLVGREYADAANLVMVYSAATLAFAVASVYAFLHVSLLNKRYAKLVLAPHLGLLVLAPFVFDSSLVALALAILVIGCSLAAASELATRRVLRARVTPPGETYGAVRTL